MAKPSRPSLLIARVQPNAAVALFQPVSVYLPQTFQALLRGLYPTGLKVGKTLDANVLDLGRKLSQRVTSFGSHVDIAIVIDATRESLPYDTYYDDMLVGLNRAKFIRERDERVSSITIACSRPNLLVETTAFPHLVDRLKDLDLALCLVQPTTNLSEPGRTRLTLSLHLASPTHKSLEESETIEVISDVPSNDEELSNAYRLSQQLNLDYDHFEIVSGRERWHFPCLLEVSRVARDNASVAYLRRRIQELCGSRPVLAVEEFRGAGIEEWLIPQLAEDPTDVDDGQMDLSGRQVVILVDFATRVHALSEVLNRLRDRGAAKVRILALVGTEETVLTDTTTSIISLPISAASPGPDECEFCRTGVAVHRENDGTQYRDELGRFDPVVFWRLLGLTEQFTRMGHYRSRVTDNHYWLRVMMKDVLGPFGEGIAHRMLDILEHESRIYAGWIDLVVAAEDEESKLLAELLVGATQSLKGKRVLLVPRSVLREVSAGELGVVANQWAEEVIGLEGRRANVIIVDQAAHHLRTYNSIKSLCDAMGWHTLAFAVILDRTGVDLELMQMLHDIQYIYLYRWPFPPRHAAECTCSEGIPTRA